jgi:hypothetical protein
MPRKEMAVIVQKWTQFRFIIALTSALLCFLPYLLEKASAAEPTEETASARSGQHDFDFLFGKWRVHYHRLMHPLSQSNDWIDFDGTLDTQPLWSGKADLTILEADAPAGHLEGMDIRMYNPRSHQWSVYWTSSDSPSLGVPVVGEFKNGRGEFFDQETYQNRAILVRYLWSEIKEDSWRWEQAFSVDGGKTWETNWINTCVREK